MGLSLGNSGRREVAAQGTRGREEGQQTAERKATVPSFPGGGKDAELNFKKKKKADWEEGARTRAAQTRRMPARLPDAFTVPPARVLRLSVARDPHEGTADWTL